MSAYARGANFERRVRAVLARLEYFVVRSAGSHGPVDLLAVRHGKVLGIQCKLGRISGKEREELRQMGRRYGFTPVIVTKSGEELMAEQA